MGLSKSKAEHRKGEEQKKSSSYFFAKSKDKLMERQSQETRQTDGEAGKPSDSPLATATATHRQPYASWEDKPDVKQKSSKKKTVIPQIIITRASTETLDSYNSLGSEDQRTIREQADWGPYSRHRNPSTAAAFIPQTKE
ncbi:PREDICTED: spermatogenesis-associated protein 33 isoform X3 [Chinchilla lanigera]|uniref:spermatogenesis-associated protein 33 isoform X3 n=1 Tax=Chinchilla lanigera TaxID=34839 RepID=UPI00038F18CD|nr:PREDICTED: spermatogenesis-associated protein 33 isoform X3 [Chinchilla lanigera]